MVCNSVEKMLEDIDNEGLHYAFNNYDEYDIKNEKFMSAYKDYLISCGNIKKVILEEFGCEVQINH